MNVFTEKELVSKTLWKIITRLRHHRQQRFVLGTRKCVVFICCLSAATPRVEKVRKGYLMIFFFSRQGQALVTKMLCSGTIIAHCNFELVG